MKLGLVLEIAIVLCGTTAPANAETTRLRLSVDALPRQDAPIKVAASEAVLPDGAREGSTLPKSWKVASNDGTPQEAGHCTDARRGSVKTVSSQMTFTAKIWEANGKTFFDRAQVDVVNDRIHVSNAERVPAVYVGEGIWAYRRAAEAVLVFARDVGSFGRSTFFECLVDDRAVAIPGGAVSFESSPEDATGVRNDMFEMTDIRPKPGPWVGVAFTAIASVSKTSADPNAMLSVVIKRP